MELRVTVTPKEIIEAQKHTCNVCGYYGIWTKEWGHHVKLVGTEYNMSEESFNICSKECRKKAKQKGLVKKWRNKK